jgi:acyl-CoA dehydrogenase
MLLLWILVLIVGWRIWPTAASPLPALGIVAVYLLAMGIFSHAPGWLLLVFWVVLAVVAAPLLLPDLRRKSLHRAAVQLVPENPAADVADRARSHRCRYRVVGRRAVQRPPGLEQTAGLPKAQLSEEEQAFIDGPTEELCAMVSDWQIGQSMDLPPEAWATSRNTASSP